MDGERKSCTERILSAIEYGKLSNDETERRLCELVEAEVNKTDSEADMELIKACQSLLWRLHTHGDIPYDSHYDANKAKIDQRLKRNTLVSNTVKSVSKMLAAAAAVVLVVLGLRGDLHWSWLEHDDTFDQQQHIITGNEIGVELIQSAIAEHGDDGQIRVSSPKELADHISFVPMPLEINEAWEFSFADITTNPIYICIDAQYVHTEHQSTVTYTTVLFTDAEDAYYTFEQSADGKSLVVDGHNVYATTNLHRTVMSWTDGLVLVRLSGEYQEQEGLLIVKSLLKEWYKQ